LGSARACGASILARRRFESDVKSHRARSEAALQAAAEAHAQARADHETKLEDARLAVARQNAEIDAFASFYAAADELAVADYCRLILENSDYPEGFSKKADTAYVRESKQLVVKYECPSFEIVPEEASYRFVKAKREISSIGRPTAERRLLYSAVIAQTALRTLHELFAADTHEHIDVVVFNGHVRAIDRGTGRAVFPCVVSVRVSRDTLEAIDLANVDSLACLKTLNASVSPRPNELVPVRPVVEFDMTDARFVDEVDVLSGLDQRPNLMELTPSEFESLITNLFERMGLETRQTQASRDGGVDCVAYDPRPIFGGKVIIQAKRYKNTVGVSAVRDLFGTLQNEGASKGILVTTSGYGKAAFDFATESHSNSFRVATCFTCSNSMRA
jgi:restriction system protein